VTSKPTFRDSSGRSLADYPHPSVAVDTAVLTVIPADVNQRARLGVLLVRRPPGPDDARATWSLPGAFLHEGETLADAVRRSLAEKAGVTGRAPQQLHVFDDPTRDDRGRVLSVAHLDVLAPATLEGLRDPTVTRIAPVPARLRLPYDHLAIIALAVEHLRAEYRVSPDPRHLLDTAFTIADLRAIHAAVTGEDRQKDTFRRQMIDQLTELSDSAAGRVGRPARLFTRAT
jgi:ADP-ribose pyrophosphatase YjhB (NUDIX family)